MIQFTKGPSIDKLRDAYNNDILQFSSSIAGIPAKCEITGAGFPTVVLYPAPDNSFWVNLRPYIIALINTRRFEDRTLTNLPTQYLYDFTDGSYKELALTIKIIFADASNDTSVYNFAWLSSVQQMEDYLVLAKQDYYVLSPFKRDTANQFYVKYWTGYPMDVPFYFPSPHMWFKNETTGIEEIFSISWLVTRLFISDGATDVTLGDYIPLLDGRNNFRIKTDALDSPKDKFLTLEKVDNTCGVYIKWLNQFGCYNYWLFEHTSIIERSTRYSDEVAFDNDNLGTAYARTLQTGKSSQDTLKAVATLLTDEENYLLSGIIDSPKIYLFTGKPFSRSTPENWIEVKLKTNQARTKNAHTSMNNYELEFELPARYTQML